MTTQTTRPRLDPSQAARLDRARELLTAEHGHDPASMAARVGQLEWHLAELLALVDAIG
jgi:hypothetical protein